MIATSADRARCDPHLLAVEDVFLAGFFGAGSHAAWIGAEIRFGQSEAADFLALLHDGEPGLLLLVAAKGVNGVHGQRGVDADERADSAVAPLQFLHHKSVFDIRHSGTAVALETGAVETQVGHGLHQFAGEAAGAIALLDDGNEVVFDKFAGGVAHQTLFVREQGVEFEEINSPELDGHQLLLVFLFLRRVSCCELCQEPRAGTQGVETLEGNKGREGSQTSREKCCRNSGNA